MRIISEARKHITKIWGEPSPCNMLYRPLHYLVQDDSEDGTLLFNSVTSELILLDTAEADLLRALPSPYVSEMDELIAHHFLVPENYDDAESVNQLRNILRKLTSCKEITSYSILPTSACNARCFYCYESSYPKLSMTPEIADKLVDFIAAHCGDKKRIVIQWFGGEPTLGEDRIDQICDGLIKKGIEYTSSTLSNGYLFTKNLVHKAKEKWKLQRVQISMDGTEDVYNKAKAYVNAEGSPYQRVLENIGNLLDEGIQVIVRMNLDSRNENDLKALIDELIRRFCKYNGFSAYVHEVFEDMGYLPVRRSEEERHKLIARKIALNHYIADSGGKLFGDIFTSAFLPCLKIGYCMADNPRSLLINPLGQFGKCDHYSFERLIGDIESELDFYASGSVTWFEPVYAESCRKCILCPICGRPEFCIGKNECHSEDKHRSIQEIKKLMRNKLSTKYRREDNEEA